jgi:hypothetical protein
MNEKLATFLVDIEDLAKGRGLVVIKDIIRNHGKKLCVVVRIEDWLDRPTEIKVENKKD